MYSLTFVENNKRRTAQVEGQAGIFKDVDDIVDLLGNASYQEATAIIIREEHLLPDFFELRTGMAGEILQKFSNYRMKLAIIGNFDKYNSKSLRDFIYESNKAGHVVFVGSQQEALDKISS